MATSSINHQVVLSTEEELECFEQAIINALNIDSGVEEKFIVVFDNSMLDCPCCCVKDSHNTIRFFYNDEATHIYELLSGKETK